MAHDHEQQDFLHIWKMVLKLERLVQNGDDVSQELPVMHPEYWRSRINALLARPAISGSTVAQASVLLVKLNGIADELRKSR
jgi:hypothetical protein